MSEAKRDEKPVVEAREKVARPRRGMFNFASSGRRAGLGANHASHGCD